MQRSPIAAVVLAAALLATSCPGGPAPAPQPAVLEPTPVPLPKDPDPTPPPLSAFNPASVSAEVKSATMVDIKSYVEELNSIIRKKDFEGWKSRLTDQYVSRYSNPEVLAGPSKTLGRTLATLYDYFVYVVYPSRQYDRVDDIDFVSETEVTAYTVNPKGEKLVLYSLEKIGGSWKIGIGRQ
jgi:hypothetical protein